MATMRQSWDIRLPSVCTSEVGTYSDLVARSTFCHQVLEFADGHRFWNVCDILYYDAAVCMMEDNCFLRRAPYRRPFYRCLEITLECLPLLEPHLHCYRSVTVPRKELEGYKGSFSVSVSCCLGFGKTHSIGGASVHGASRGIGTQSFFLESRNQTRHFLWYVFRFSAALLKRATFAAWGEPMVDPRTTSR
jgi:hypothetical protein